MIGQGRGVFIVDRRSAGCNGGFAAAQCGKPPAYRRPSLYENAARLSLAAAYVKSDWPVRQSLAALCCGRAANHYLSIRNPRLRSGR